MIKSVLRSPITTAVLFVAAVALILGGTIGGARAVLNIQSHDYVAQTQLTEIHVALTENGVIRENMDEDAHIHADAGYQHTLLNDLVSQTEGELVVGHTYKEELAARNVGDGSATGTGIDQYVRVTVYKYWVDSNGKKVQSLDPSLIDLHFVDTQQAHGKWTIDTASSTGERTVLYYSTILAPQNGAHDGLLSDSDPFTDTITISDKVLTAKAADGSLMYKGCKPEIKVVVDAVQTHNASDAKTSAWGIDK